MKLSWPVLVWLLAAEGDHVTLGEPRVALDPEGNQRIELIAGWANAWRDEVNHDALWLMVRQVGPGPSRPVRLAAGGHRGAGAELRVPADGSGVFVLRAEPGRGDVRFELQLVADPPLPPGVELEAWAVEMVLVPAGPFELGDDAPRAVEEAAFFRSGEAGRPAGLFRVADEAAIEVAPEDGSLYYRADRTPQYRGDQSGPIPAAFPKGTRAFYAMKRELTQGEYARFLSALPAVQRTFRSHELPPEGEEDRSTWTIRAAGDGYAAEVPQRPCNFVTWEDTMAWTDWMALRPMTELEFEKAARGPQRPLPLDFPWGTDSTAGLEREPTPERDLTASGVEAERNPGRVALGRSFFGLLDLSGSLWERVVTCGHPVGRAFEATHGDGALAADGAATNEDWPRSSADQREADGIGYRGGAQYFGGEPNITNPWSVVGARTFAAWNGAYRYKTYSARAVRTAPTPAPSE